MADFIDKTRAVVPPMDGAPGAYTPQQLSGSGATEVHNSRRLTRGHLHELIVGSQGVRVSFRGKSGISDAVDDTTSVVLPADTIYPFLALEGEKDENGDPKWGSTYVYVEADDGASDFEAWVVQRGR